MATETKMTPAEIKAGLDGHTGDLKRFPHICGTIYTPGVRFLADSCGAYWLLDVVASYQREIQKKAQRDRNWRKNMRALKAVGQAMTVGAVLGQKDDEDEGPLSLWEKLAEFQVWKLKVDLEKREGVVTCEDGDKATVIRQKIPHTDFPLDEATIWVGTDDGETYVMYLPSER